jgi:dCTP deaminase
VLSDITIRRLVEDGVLGIEPFDETAVQPASVDLHLGPEVRPFTALGPINPTMEHAWRSAVSQPINNGYLLEPGKMALLSTIEKISLPAHIAARVEGKSSLARLGLQVHITAGFIDPGFSGQITLEAISVVPTWLIVGMKICQISFYYLDRPAERPYGTPGLGSKYQGQSGPTASRLLKEN